MIRHSWSTCRHWLHRRVVSKHRPATRRRGGISRVVCLEALECRQLLSAADVFSSAIPIGLGGDQPQVGNITQTPTYYALNVREAGRLTAEVSATGGDTRLTLLSSDGVVLMQSDGQSPENRDDLVDIHVVGSFFGTTYFLKVEALTGGGEYTLNANFASAIPPFGPLSVGSKIWGVASADFNADGVVDLAGASPIDGSIALLLGLGDGTFGSPRKVSAAAGATQIVAEDFNKDGQIDLATSNLYGTTVSVLLGRGDGTFDAQQEFDAGFGPRSISVTDFDGDGRIDFVVATSGSGISLLRGQGDGTFEAPIRLSQGFAFSDVAVADINNDGRLDVTATDTYSSTVSVFLRQSDGTLSAPLQFAVGVAANNLILRDFNGDGWLDIATANTRSDDVSVLIGRGDGTFNDQVRYGGCAGVFQLTAGDFDHDGYLDLATVNTNDGSISVLLGRGEGTFREAASFFAGDNLLSIVAADFNGDGALDLAAGSLLPEKILVFTARGDGSFQPGTRISPSSATLSVATGDFNEDGRLDIAAVSQLADVSIELGQGDGTFRSNGRVHTGVFSISITQGDFNGDGHLDLALANVFGANVVVVLGRGDGTFHAPVSFAIGSSSLSVVSGDFNGDGLSDLATANTNAGTVSVLLGRRDGSFDTLPELRVSPFPFQLTIGDFNRDGKLDLATANLAFGDLSILMGRGDGTFDDQIQLPVGTPVGLIAAGDFNNDGRSDLAVAAAQFGEPTVVSVFLVQEDGTFARSTQFIASPALSFLRAEDFDGDGYAELIVPSPLTSQLTIYRRLGDGSFQPVGQSTVGVGAFGSAVGDFNGDGRIDLATSNFDSSVSVLLNQANGTFRDQLQIGTVTGPVSVINADFNGDGRSDLVTANPNNGVIAVQLGLQTGQFQDPTVVSVLGRPSALATGDFNRDGRPDVAVANDLTNTVSILIGVGRGTFEPPVTFSVGQHPSALLTGDFNQDGIIDLATSDFGTDTVSILLGRGDGTFLEAPSFDVGDGPTALTVSDVNGDGQSDLIVANSLSRDLTVLTGMANGTFGPAATLPLAIAPGAVATGDFNRDGKLDITITNPTKNTVSILFGESNGTFQSPVEFAVGTVPESLAVGDFNRDGHWDIATANNNSHNVTVLLGQGDGTFPDQTQFEVGSYPTALITGDFNNDDRLDLVTANGLAEPISVGLGLGNGAFVKPGASSPLIQSKPIVADLNYDGILDVVVLRNDGKLLFRAGAGNGTFEAPIVINTDSADINRDVTLASLDGMVFILAINARTDAIDFFTFVGSQFAEVAEFDVPIVLPSQILTSDVNGDGRDDVILTSAVAGKVFVYLQQPNDEITNRAPNYQIEVGSGLSDVALVDVNSDGLPEIVVTDQVSGDVRVLLNSATDPFVSQLRFRAGTGLSNVVQVNGSQQVQSRDLSVAVVAGEFNDDAIPDLAVLNQGANRVDILLGNGQGGVFNPTAATSLLTGHDPVALVTADFNGDGRADLAVLNKGSDDLSIFLQNDHGGFTEQFSTDSNGRINAGNTPSGLSVGDINGDGRLDLFLGNERGDVLTLLGNGDGTFRPFQRIDRHVGLAVTGHNSNEGPAFAIVDQSLDRLTYQSHADGVTFQQGREEGLLAPTAVKFADLNADGIDDLIVCNGGSNEVRVYLGLGNDRFDLGHRFFVGTDPSGITVSDLNADGTPDLVIANRGSNDVSLLFGQGQSSHWTMRAGPRLQTGSGPIASVVQDMNADGIPDIVVANQQSNDVYLLAGVSRGFFNDQQPVIIQTGDSPSQLFVGHFDHSDHLDVVTVNAASHDLTVISGFGNSGLSHVRTVNLSEIDPVAAIVQDFDHDGFSDLIVAHQSGQFTLWLGGSDNVQAINAPEPDQMLNISDLVLGRVTANSIEVFFTSAGNTTATVAVFALNFNSSTPPNSGLPPNFTPLPTPVPTYSSQVFSTNTFNTASNEAVERVSFDRTAGFTQWPVTMFTGEFSSSGLDAAVAEFSSPSGSSLEVIATLVLGFHESSAVISAEEEADSDQMAAADAYVLASDRDLLVTGVTERLIQQHLQDRATTDTATDILFSSPLELFDDSRQVASRRAGREVVDGVTFLAPNQDAPVQPANQDHSQPPVPPSQKLQRASGKLGRSKGNDDLTLDGQNSASLSPIHLCVLVSCFALVVPLAQESPTRQPLSNRNRSAEKV